MHSGAPGFGSRPGRLPLQDVLGLGSESRMNTPGTTGPHNWSWRVREEQLRPELAERLRTLTEIYGRLLPEA